MSMTIGEVLEALKACKPTASVHFDFCDCVPAVVDSWRGVYAEAALGWSPYSRDAMTTVSQLIVELKSSIADDREFVGWKGGKYRYRLDTPLHVDNRGKCTYTDLASVVDEDYRVTLPTRYAGV